MNEFDKRLVDRWREGLRAENIEVIQANIGLRCNQDCEHCHLSCSPQRSELMAWPIMETILELAGRVGCRLVDLTGGAPELNPDLRRFITTLCEAGQQVQVRTNLTALLEPGLERIPEFLREHNVHLVASMPCYLEENVRNQRGPRVYAKSIEVLKRLNTLGYGIDPKLPLNLVYNPAGPFLSPAQSGLEADYRKHLSDNFGIQFSHLLTITNMPIGRFRARLKREKKEQEYMQLLRDAFNENTVDGLMCRHQISIAWDGTLYDCDFNLALGLPVDHDIPNHVRDFDPEMQSTRRIVTGEHCFGCTAGAGSSCGGALA